jgi:deoxyribodipyrimidine photo-lyase
LNTFFEGKLLGYREAISSPLTAPTGCSRLSPYLAMGVVSMKEIAAVMAERHAYAKLNCSAQELSRVEDALQFYVERLYWRSAYLQTFEADSSLELVSQHPGTRGLRESEFNERWFARWQAAETGYPFIDAGLRMLRETGWINMRLRGTLISFAVNELWLHWKEPALFLAREFLDYEPGIHYSQMQIHAGTYLSTHPLMYNPVKQAQDHDSRGDFVRMWLPSLAKVPTEFIFEPWKMPRAVQVACGVHIGQQYPAPVVPYEAAGNAARTTIEAARAYRQLPSLAYSRQRLTELRAMRQGSLFG